MINGMNSKLISGSTNQTATSSFHEPVFSLCAAKWRNTETSLVSFESINLRSLIFLKFTFRLYKAIFRNVFPSLAEWQIFILRLSKKLY